MTDEEALRTFLSTFASCFLTHDTEEREAACEYVGLRALCGRKLLEGC